MKGATPAQPLSLLLPFHSIFILQYSSSHLNQRSKNKWSELSEMKFMEFVWLASFVEWMGYGPWPSSAANINFTLSWRVALSCFALQLTCPSEDRPASISYSFNSINFSLSSCLFAGAEPITLLFFQNKANQEERRDQLEGNAANQWIHFNQLFDWIERIGWAKLKERENKAGLARSGLGGRKQMKQNKLNLMKFGLVNAAGAGALLPFHQQFNQFPFPFQLNDLLIPFQSD